MRYKITEYNDIRESYIIPFTVNWKTLFIHFLMWLPGLFLTFYSSFVNGWDTYDENGMYLYTNLSGIFAIIFLILGLFASGALMAITEKYPISIKKYKEYSLLYFNQNHLDIPIYKEAYKECIQDIKNDNFDRTEWNVIFRNLSSEADRLKEGEKQIKKINIPKRDFAGELKDSNDMYLKGIK